MHKLSGSLYHFNYSALYSTTQNILLVHNTFFENDLLPTTAVQQSQYVDEVRCYTFFSFGPVQNEDGSWRIRMNYELNELIENADIVRFIKSRRIAWLGHVMRMDDNRTLNPLNPELNPICYLLALLGAHHFLHVSRIRVKLLTFRRLMSYIYIYMEHPFLMFLDHTQRRSTVGRTPLDE